MALELEYSNMLDFGGISTDVTESALRRVDKGGMATAEQLRAVSSLLTG